MRDELWRALVRLYAIKHGRKKTMTTDEPAEAIMQYFSYAHLPPDLQAMSKVFADSANEVLKLAPRGPERSVALRKLLEGKDAAVRAMLQKPVPWRDRASGPVDVPQGST